jgi:hypothetical protein
VCFTGTGTLDTSQVALLLTDHMCVVDNLKLLQEATCPLNELEPPEDYVYHSVSPLLQRGNRTKSVLANSATVISFRTLVDVLWQSGQVERRINSACLTSEGYFNEANFMPTDRVQDSRDDDGYSLELPGVVVELPNQNPQIGTVISADAKEQTCMVKWDNGETEEVAAYGLVLEESRLTILTSPVTLLEANDSKYGWAGVVVGLLPDGKIKVRWADGSLCTIEREKVYVVEGQGEFDYDDDEQELGDEGEWLDEEEAAAQAEARAAERNALEATVQTGSGAVSNWYGNSAAHWWNEGNDDTSKFSLPSVEQLREQEVNTATTPAESTTNDSTTTTTTNDNDDDTNAGLRALGIDANNDSDSDLDTESDDESDTDSQPETESKHTTDACDASNPSLAPFHARSTIDPHHFAAQPKCTATKFVSRILSEWKILNKSLPGICGVPASRHWLQHETRSPQ